MKKQKQTLKIKPDMEKFYKEVTKLRIKALQIEQMGYPWISIRVYTAVRRKK